ncbi:MalY/PatB family protein [Paratractidigestivibacter sp.]|uniref:MalY/PatB family protein n=1 Tax=Paratractidigestivibacter sp. TaxID=2847316 RepID=UPI002ABD2BAE|nr:MalY/PatB family protein [Paratractidigestivibacter sp.]
MQYDFTARVNRRGVGAFKWDEMLSENPSVPEGVVPLSVADMELENPPEVRRALHDLIDAGPLGYTGATDRFTSACIDWQVRRHGWRPEADWIVTTPGVVPAVFCAVSQLTEPGDAVIIQPPVYYPFKRAVESAGRGLIENPLKEVGGRYEMDFDDLAEKAARPEAKMLILCSPHNPVGRVWEISELRRLIEICVANGVTIVSDEIHNDLIMPGNAHTTIASVMSPEEMKSLVVCTAPSKTFNLAGIQASVIYVPDAEFRARFKAGFEKLSLGGLNAFAYTATTAAYEQCEGWLSQLIDLVWTNFSRLVDWVAQSHPELDVAELQGTYLAWVDFRSWDLRDEELKAFMREEALLWLDEGDLFGEEGSGFERFNLACPTDVLEAALARLDEAAPRRGFGKNC